MVEWFTRNKRQPQSTAGVGVAVNVSLTVKLGVRLVVDVSDGVGVPERVAVQLGLAPGFFFSHHWGRGDRPIGHSKEKVYNDFLPAPGRQWRSYVLSPP